nr:copper resistance protein CopC [Aminobacter sp. HY435]
MQHRLATLLIAAVALLGVTAAASAHASLLRSAPAEGAVIDAWPAQVTLSFSEPVRPLVLRLIGPDGTSRPLDAVASDSMLAIDPPNASNAAGSYLLAWRVVSSDGHPVGGTVAFAVGAPSATPPTLPQLDDRVLDGVLWSTRLALYLCLFFGAGGAFAHSWLISRGHDGEGTVATFAALGLVAAALAFGLHGVDALGAPLGLVGDSVAWRAAAATSYSLTTVLAVVALALTLLTLVSDGILARALSLGALACVGAALAASGHASSAQPQWLMRPMVFVHGVGVAIWAGALLPLGLAYGRGTPEAGEALRRFSASIPYVVAALIGAGIVLAFVQVETPSALWRTAYGRVLLAKLALVVPLLLLAAANRWRLTGPTLAGEADATRRLVRNIAWETLAVAAILAVVAGFRFTPPPRILAIEAAEPAAIHIHTAEAMADLTLSPGRAGKVAATIMLMTGDFGPLDAGSVQLRLSKGDTATVPVVAAAHKPGDGTWRVDAVELPAAGTWDAAIEVAMPDGSQATLTGTIVIRP